MIKISTLTHQNYEKLANESKIIFIETEKDICYVVAYHFAENIKDNIEILTKLTKINTEAEVIKIETDKNKLFLLNMKFTPKN